MKKLRAAIIGCGNIYTNHANSLFNSEFAELVAVVDVEEDRARNAAAQYNCAYYTDYKEMLKDESIDVVHICTPHYLHSTMAIDSMKAGKHVLTEKPMDINVERAKEMIKAEDEYGKFLAVCFQNRYNDTSVELKKLIDDGSLGKIKGIKAIITWDRGRDYYLSGEWRGMWATEGGGALINQSIHDLDLMQWFGGEIEGIKGNADIRVLNDIIEVEDTADATIRYKNGAIGIFFATNCYSTNSSVLIEVHLEKGILKLEDGELYLIENGVKTLLCYDTAPDSVGKSYWGAGHKKLIIKFYEAIVNNDKEGYVTAEEGLKSLEMIEAIYKTPKALKYTE
jgi:UDP-N-acetyl-2-amino-2-deoxyglucuronate dehydrogenase